jgi:hypothetical protein
MSAQRATVPEPGGAAPTLELLWQQDACAHVFMRSQDGTLRSGELRVGRPANVELVRAGTRVSTRRIEASELVRLAESPPAGVDLGGRGLMTYAIVDLARRSLAEGLVHPYLEHGDGSWHAFWGATLDASVQGALTEIAAALPAVSADAFGGDRNATVHDLYPVLVDQIARDRLRADRVRLTGQGRARRPGAAELFLEGLTASGATLPPHPGYAALRRRLADWVDTGLGRRSAAHWKLSLHLDERLAEDAEGTAGVVLELWLHAEDDPTLSLPASLLWGDGDEVWTLLSEHLAIVGVGGDGAGAKRGFLAAVVVRIADGDNLHSRHAEERYVHAVPVVAVPGVADDGGAQRGLVRLRCSHQAVAGTGTRSVRTADSGLAGCGTPASSIQRWRG